MANRIIVTDIGNLGNPLLHLANRLTFAVGDADNHFRRALIVGSIERDRSKGVALEAAICLPTNPVSRGALSHETR